jgi:hypothetical protein
MFIFLTTPLKIKYVIQQLLLKFSSILMTENLGFHIFLSFYNLIISLFSQKKG